MSNKTAVEWLEYQFLSPATLYSHSYIMDKLKQAKELEKEQIIDARVSGFASSAEGWNGEIPCMKWSEMVRETKCEKYYNATYGK